MGYFDKQEIINISIHSPHARGDFHRLRGHLLG